MLETAIIGAGPYGLSIAAYFRRNRIPFRIFGRPMDSWLGHMPKGMCLKSDGFASNLYDQDGEATLRRFCAERKIEYSDAGIPVRLETFTSYGLAFRERMVPELEGTLVTSVDRLPDGFLLKLETGETLPVRRVILAIGITHFEHVPAELANLPAQYFSHSARHHDLEPFRGRSVAVIGGGASATDLAGLLRDGEADVQLIARQQTLRFHGKPQLDKPRSLWQRIRHPQSGLGPGMRSRFFSDAPDLFHSLPEGLRLKIVRTTLGPSGGWFIKDKVMGRVPLLLGYALESAEIQNGQVHLHLRGQDGTKREVVTGHVIAATGYKVDMERLTFLNPDIRSSIKTVAGSPVLSSAFESSVPGLYFTGVAAANSFGPVMRFAFGAGFSARHLTRVVTKSLAHNRASVDAARLVTTTK